MGRQRGTLGASWIGDVGVKLKGDFEEPLWIACYKSELILSVENITISSSLYWSALGDYTRIISDFSVLPSEVREGRVGTYWYHEDTQAFFDDVDHYRIIKAMCRLSCSVCDKMEAQGAKRQGKFRNIEQLKGHLFHRHRLVMCGLCLEGRKVFICEQKLYTRAQLNQHINTGDSEVDGTESERGGFMGHPMCESCKTPFYGDNELYSHMSTEHYTCHICQRQQHPGQYEYYKNYDDLEIHFRRDHYLCEDEACLVKKFIVFHSEAELKMTSSSI
ncbi:PREDICTED: E3 ubiquitin-protein ligase HEL2-like [Theobroma cacao]|uniref:E3 ubiquitin-protein ligase HEL2-like n=1 Tax=Theobroma cacao TaxID=3641 RepID=A0AB32W7C5_THECC|nr:PREDICTED: E3 ubiquitin-protein ligase HEL2-like [Theobroma cacao]